MHKRTGLRKPKKHLKTWDSKDWTRKLTPRLSVGMVDEELPYGKEGGRKSWYLSLTVDPDLLTKFGPVLGAPTKGKTVLLFEDDVMAFAEHLMVSGLVTMDEDGRLLNGRAEDWEDAEREKRKKKKR